MTTREKLATLLCQATGALFEAHKIHRNPPAAIANLGACSWDSYGVLPETGRMFHVYSWDPMWRCVKHGIDLVSSKNNEAEISAKK